MAVGSSPRPGPGGPVCGKDALIRQVVEIRVPQAMMVRCFGETPDAPRGRYRAVKRARRLAGAHRRGDLVNLYSVPMGPPGRRALWFLRLTDVVV